MVNRLRMRIELVPKPLWERILRSRDGLGKARWDIGAMAKRRRSGTSIKKHAAVRHEGT
jgi:hypothetical protein